MQKAILGGGLLVLLSSALPNALAAAPTLGVTQAPSTTISSSNLSGSPGSDLTSTAICSTGLSLNISNANNYGWTCYFSLGSASNNWPSNLSLSVKLSNAGSGSGSTYSSTNNSFIALTTSPQAVFYGQGNQSGIGVQCQLANLSLVNCPPTSSTATLPIAMTLQSQ